MNDENNKLISTQSRSILLADPDEAFGQTLTKVLGDGCGLQQSSDTNRVIANLDTWCPDAILVNFDSSHFKAGWNAREIIEAASNRDIPVPVIAYSWDARGQNAREAFVAGAFDILEQPLDIQQLKFAIDRACRRAALVRELAQAQQLLRAAGIDGLVGKSKSMLQVNQLTRKVAGVLTTVLITGESGTGKGVLASAIHQLSPRAAKPFVAFSLCSFPDSLIDDELFGHERGAFTGATQARRGRFEEANGGTIFIDEIGDLALPLQAKLLRVLQERTVERLGSNVSRPIDVRVICATNRNLEKMVQEGTFREDLYFRISVVKIPMPSLRNRKEDIPLLTQHFVHMFAKTHHKAVRAFTPAFISTLSQYSWPGNVRELQNVIERSIVLANGNEYLDISDLPEELRGVMSDDEISGGSFQHAIQSFKRELVRSALHKHEGNKSRAALELGISRCYLHRLLNQLDLDEWSGIDSHNAADPEIPEIASDLRRLSAAVRIA